MNDDPSGSSPNNPAASIGGETTAVTLTKNSVIGISVAGLVALAAIIWQASTMHGDIVNALRNGDARYSESRDRQEATARVDAQQAAQLAAMDKRITLIEATRYTSRDAREDRDRMIEMQSQMVALTREISQLREAIKQLGGGK